MALNTRRLEKSQKSSSFTSGGFFRFKEGKNTIRVFPFKHKVRKTDYAKGFYNKKDTKPGESFDEIDREVLRHFTEEGVINCLLTDCKYCGEAVQYLDSPKKSDKDIGSKLKAGRAFYVNLVDTKNDPNKIQIGSISSSVYNVVLSYVMDTEYGEEILGCTGRDFIVEYDKSQTPAKMYTVKLRDQERCEVLDPELYDDITDLFYCEALEPGWSSNDDIKDVEDNVTEDDEEKVERKKASKEEEVDDKDNDFTDEDSGKLPWEKGEEGVQIGAFVSFKEGDDTISGVIEDVDPKTETAIVKVKKDIYDIPIAELTVAKKQSRSRKR